MKPYCKRCARCVLYARYSTEMQRAASIADQLGACEARAAREGWQVVARLEDQAISGATMLRPGYQALQALIRAGGVDVVLTESLDRLSRDQEHIAGLYKLTRFSDVRIVTLSEGEVSELHIGLKGTMGALFLRDLADKTRRGLEGRVRDGRSGGGLSYGYRVVRGPVDQKGESEHGLRAIAPDEAIVVQRIFRDFADGHSPIAIAKRLNAEAVAGPRGRLWSDGTIRGDARSGTGILRNTLYIGQLVWNRRRWIKDPLTGNRLARANTAEARVITAVPELRIVDQALWDRAQARLSTAARPDAGRPRAHSPWLDRRPRHLTSGKVFCGVCGARFDAIGKDYLGCHQATKQGACSNTVRLRRSALEASVLGALDSQLMQPDAVAVFVEEFTAEWNRMAAETSATADARRRELDGVRRKLSGLIEAIADGLRAPGLQGRLDELEARRAALEAEIAAPSPSRPRLHGNLSEIYRARVARLRAGLSAGEGPEILEAARALIERIEISPRSAPDQPARIDVEGHLAALLGAAGVRTPTPPARGAGGVPGVFDGSAKLVAGIGFEPMTFRL